MSRNLERFARLTTSGPRNRKGRTPDQFVLEDLLVALGWIGKAHVADGILAKYTGGEEIPPALFQAVRSRWRVPSRKHRLSAEEFDALCLLAISEHFNSRTCKACHGTGLSFRWHKGKYKPFSCAQCDGTGRRPFSVRSKAKAVGIHKNTWGQRDLENLYQRMLDSLRTWETHGSRKCDEFLRK